MAGGRQFERGRLLYRLGEDGVSMTADDLPTDIPAALADALGEPLAAAKAQIEQAYTDDPLDEATLPPTEYEVLTESLRAASREVPRDRMLVILDAIADELDDLDRLQADLKGAIRELLVFLGTSRWVEVILLLGVLATSALALEETRPGTWAAVWDGTKELAQWVYELRQD